ncbi:hypothetical protein A2Z33_02190 [Candidatus Gottesmanbacteria bacterium RBG_16_52_11]|uniref:Major facilitator superfamily (MFS) profile domain-containing protein n=1 Tax=Candidatus Gottesmanbacteria bacterium RBG_16_52_11 TaxID=1798374 RepID=A0A1F5YRH0_9BACT|nr:MAG: hypothetical protein A2Z33_02190 [Candidatus Gottesmanbacteria bacterium RBG_16_52_11]
MPVFLTLLQMAGSALSFVTGPAGAITSVYTRKFADGFRVPILVTIQNREIESRYRATALSAIALSGNILISLSGPLIGMSMERYQPSSTMGYFFFIGLLVVLPAAWILRSRTASHTGVVTEN